MGAAGQRKRGHHRDELSRGDVLFNPGPWPAAMEAKAGHRAGRPPAMDGILWNGWQGGLFRPRCQQNRFPPGAGWRAVGAERGAKEGADGGGSEA